MTKEEKEILLKDLCTRLPFKNGDGMNTIIDDKGKPYLRPLSSMTEKEKADFKKLCSCDSKFKPVSMDTTMSVWSDGITEIRLTYK